MKDLLPTPQIEDYIKQFQKDEQLADEEAKGASILSQNPDSDSEVTEPQNELGVVLTEKEWFKKKKEM
jgi:hypothetical protein